MSRRAAGNFLAPGEIARNFPPAVEAKIRGIDREPVYVFFFCMCALISSPAFQLSRAHIGFYSSRPNWVPRVFFYCFYLIWANLSSASSALLFYLLRAQSRYLFYRGASHRRRRAHQPIIKYTQLSSGAFDSRKIYFCGRTDAAAGADSRSLRRGAPPPHRRIIIILVWKLIAWTLINATPLSIRKLGLFAI